MEDQERFDYFIYYFEHMLYWVNDNIGNGDGTQFINEAWRHNPKLAADFVSKWKQYVRNCAAAIGSKTQVPSWAVQQLALQQFLMSLSSENLQIFIEYALKNGR